MESDSCRHRQARGEKSVRSSLNYYTYRTSSSIALVYGTAQHLPISLFHSSFPPRSTANLFIRLRVPTVPLFRVGVYIVLARKIFVHRPTEETEQ
jgi:hypothetical protein